MAEMRRYDLRFYPTSETWGVLHAGTSCQLCEVKGYDAAKSLVTDQLKGQVAKVFARGQRIS